jgi:outer membrane protein OmpA-like peptidoglycan-associated protein
VKPLLAIGACLLVCATAGADERDRPGHDVVSGQQIEQALSKPKSRGITLRAVTETKGTAEPANIDLNIPFQLNSSELQPAASAQLEQLEAALKSESLAGDRFMVAGHTDAQGSAEYNRQLSLRRAETVKRFLVARGISPGRLESTGFGKDRLLHPDEPNAAANRRVEIRNLGSVPRE